MRARHRLWQSIESHLGSRDVARVIYGAVIGLALVIAVEDHPPPPGRLAGLLLATAVAIGLAELYSEAIAIEARERRRVAAAGSPSSPRSRSRSSSAPASRRSSSCWPPRAPWRSRPRCGCRSGAGSA